MRLSLLNLPTGLRKAEMIGKWVYEDGKIVGQILHVEFQQASQIYNPNGTIKDHQDAGWILLIEEYETGMLIERYADGLVIELVPESEKRKDKRDG